MRPMAQNRLACPPKTAIFRFSAVFGGINQAVVPTPQPLPPPVPGARAPGPAFPSLPTACPRIAHSLPTRFCATAPLRRLWRLASALGR